MKLKISRRGTESATKGKFECNNNTSFGKGGIGGISEDGGIVFTMRESTDATFTLNAGLAGIKIELEIAWERGCCYRSTDCIEVVN